MLVGRGSSDPDVKRDLTRIAGTVGAEESSKTCGGLLFNSMLTPSFQESLEEVKRSRNEASIRDPLFIFYWNINE